MATKSDRIEIQAVQSERLQLWVVGTSPILLNRMSEKARHVILLGSQRESKAIQGTRLKHDPVAEYQASPYRLADPNAPTLLAVMSSAFKGAAMTAALDLPGVAKTQIGRLLWVEGEYTPLFGIPQLHMAVTRSADINRTPDIRTRAVVARWAASVSVSFVVPLVNEQSVINLLAAAGLTAGVGDWRPEKGKGAFGQFRVTDRNDQELATIVKEGGRAAQIQAIDNPVAYDSDTADLLEWANGEAKRRGMKMSVPVLVGANGASADDEDESEE